MRIATLNLQNLRLLDAGGPELFGARDRDEDGDESLDAADRRLTAALLSETGADVVALQEVFDARSLDFLHDRYLVPLGCDWPHRVCLPGNDGRGLDVAAMSRRPWDSVRSHAGLTPGEVGLDQLPGDTGTEPVFRRDCLAVRFAAFTLFVVHFKAPWPDPERSWIVRRNEARAVRWLAERAGPFWLVAGDLNEPTAECRAVADLEAAGENLMNRLPEAERWTWYDPHEDRHGCPDALIASPALAARFCNAVPRVLRRGLGREAGQVRAPRLPGVGNHRPHASDHAAVILDLPGI